MWQCASQASGGRLNFGVLVLGSGPGMVGLNIGTFLGGSGQPFNESALGRLGAGLGFGPALVWLSHAPGRRLLECGRLERGDGRAYELLDRVRRVGAVSLAA